MDLIGYKFGIEWQGKECVEEYKLVITETDIEKRELNYKTPLALSFSNKNVGDVIEFSVNSHINKFRLQYIKPPSMIEVIKNRNITKLYHFTPIENLDTVLNYGILSVEKLNLNNIKYVGNDKYRLENKLNCVSCSVEFPNNLVRKVRENELKCKHVILEIDIDILLNKKAYCCITNAATNRGANIEGVDNFYKLFEGFRYKIPNNFTSYEQAEVLIKDGIEPEYITKIIFNSKQDAENYMLNDKVCVDENLFLTRAEYLRKINKSYRKY